MKLIVGIIAVLSFGFYATGRAGEATTTYHNNGITDPTATTTYRDSNGSRTSTTTYHDNGITDPTATTTYP